MAAKIIRSDSTTSVKTVLEIETLTDGSKVYNVEVSDSSYRHRASIKCPNLYIADKLYNLLREAIDIDFHYAP